MRSLLVLGICLSALLHSNDAACQHFVARNAVDSAALDAMRGGFGYGDNLLVTLGIDRMVRINGNVVDQSTVDFGEVGRLAGRAVHLSGDALQGVRLIQNGQVSQLASGLASGAIGGTILQNSLNDQMISNQTTIRASVNNAGVIQAMNFNASLTQALNSTIPSK